MWLNDRLPGGAVVAFLANVLGEVCLAFGLAMLVIGAWRGTWRLARPASVVVTTVVAAVRAWRAVAASNPPSGSTRVLPGEVLKPRESTIIPGRWRLDATDTDSTVPLNVVPPLLVIVRCRGSDIKYSDS